MTLRDLSVAMALDGEPREVLVVEDHVPLLLRLTEFWAEMGHRVVALQGVWRIEGDVAVGPGATGEGEVSIDLRTPDAAFLDHYFLGRHTNGTFLTHELRLRGDARILGMSSDAAANASMVGAGANLALRKAELMRLLGI